MKLYDFKNRFAITSGQIDFLGVTLKDKWPEHFLFIIFAIKKNMTKKKLTMTMSEISQTTC